MFSRHPRSPEVTYDAPVARIRSTLRSVILQEICGYLREKTPPKPQHRSLSSISTNSTPGMARSSFRGASTTPSPRRRWHESWYVTFPEKSDFGSVTPRTSTRNWESS